MKSYKPLLLYLCALLLPMQAIGQEKKVLGWVEKVRIFPGDIILHAKLDSGSDYSSLNASDLTEFEKNGEPWVKFTVTNRFGTKTAIERKVSRTALIKRVSKKSSKRPVIRLGVCVGTTYMETDVNVVDRTNFDYQMLIGRSFLAGNIIIDPATTFTSEPHCKGVAKP